MPDIVNNVYYSCWSIYWLVSDVSKKISTALACWGFVGDVSLSIEVWSHALSRLAPIFSAFARPRP